ncbi:MAG: hypothetical protein JST41_07970 [Bacteroidetes bacterium]|jgi:hypothetical protein|nr:hypothetical protein [Bacteroidota bacterium]MBX7130006.1 hypothetical protein [Flavobacteriales bacterium]MCC6654437.1 hypothetical protein [Flavobacteriales bacterium]HMU12800.1 hypothetical protein [Flavobacteriales bacterium]HMW95765.1 hypothetical protein [Flavobacteriales bacterium]
MRRTCLVVTTLLSAFMATAQQGWLPLSTDIDGPIGGRIRSIKADPALHSGIRPYLREDLKLIPGADSLVPKAWRPWLDSLSKPRHGVYGTPFAEAMIGGSFGEKDPIKFRTGLGGQLDWSAGKRWSLHVDGMVWAETLPNYLDSVVRSIHVTPGEGYAYGDAGAGSVRTHHDWSAWVDHKAGQYFHITLGRGKNFFGEGLRSLFLSDNAYSYPYLRITTTVWKVRYVNLFAAMSDIRGTNGQWNSFDLKWTSMHYLSWNALSRLNISLFEAIIWQDNDPAYRRGFDINYLNPVIFYRPAEFGLGSPDNALLGFAVNTRVGRRTLLYGQLMFDEFLLREVRGGRGWFANKQGVQFGAVGHDAFNRKGLTLRAEFNYVRPFMYTHSDTRQNYAHFNQPLAHPYGSNFWEALVQGEWRKDHWLVREVFSFAVLGQDTSTANDQSYGNNMFLPESARPVRDSDGRLENYGYYLGGPSMVHLYHNELRAGWIIEPRSGWMLEAAWTLRVRVPERGDDLMTNYLRLGISVNLRDRHVFQDARYVLAK